MEERDYMDLLELLLHVKDGVAQAFPKKYWVKAEITSWSPRVNGHCYLSLGQSRGGKPVAESRAMIWKWHYPLLKSLFEEKTGQALGAGITVLVRVQVNFSELFGISLFIDDIDPAFTLGEKALERKRSIERLTSGGYMEQLYRGSESLRSTKSRLYRTQYTFRYKRFLASASASFTFRRDEIEQTWFNEVIDNRTYKVFSWLNGADSHIFGGALRLGWLGKVMTANLSVESNHTTRTLRETGEVKQSDDWRLTAEERADNLLSQMDIDQQAAHGQRVARPHSRQPRLPLYQQHRGVLYRELEIRDLGVRNLADN